MLLGLFERHKTSHNISGVGFLFVFGRQLASSQHHPSPWYSHSLSYTNAFSHLNPQILIPSMIFEITSSFWIHLPLLINPIMIHLHQRYQSHNPGFSIQRILQLPISFTSLFSTKLRYGYSVTVIIINQHMLHYPGCILDFSNYVQI